MPVGVPGVVLVGAQAAVPEEVPVVGLDEVPVGVLGVVLVGAQDAELVVAQVGEQVVEQVGAAHWERDVVLDVVLGVEQVGATPMIQSVPPSHASSPMTR